MKKFTLFIPGCLLAVNLISGCGERELTEVRETLAVQSEPHGISVNMKKMGGEARPQHEAVRVGGGLLTLVELEAEQSGDLDCASCPKTEEDHSESE